MSGLATRMQWTVISAIACLVVAPNSARADSIADASQPACTLQSGGYRTVARIIDGETLALDDGREVRLIGALAPRAADAGAAPNAWPIEIEAVRALTALVLGQTVKLAFADRRTDRYGRLLAHVFVGSGAQEKWVQGELLAAGVVRAYGLPGSFTCFTELLAHERIARTKDRGLWSLSLYRMKAAHLTGLLMRRRSQYEIVSGTVASVSNTKSAVYLNFGSDWKTDFTARVAKDVLAAHPDLANILAGYKGKRVAVRGWIERRNGPLVDVRHSDQIEILDTSSKPAEISQRTPPTPAEPASTPPGEPSEHLPEIDDHTGRSTSPEHERPADPSLVQPGAVDL